MLETLPNASHRVLVRAQHYFFFPILLFARLSWCQQSVAHAYTLSKVCCPFINNAADINHHLHLLNAWQVCRLCMSYLSVQKAVSAATPMKVTISSSCVLTCSFCHSPFTHTSFLMMRCPWHSVLKSRLGSGVCVPEPFLLAKLSKLCGNCVLPLQSPKHGWDEMLCLVVHYTWYLGLVFSHLSLGRGLLFVLMTQMICGFFLSIVFVQSHNGMEVYSTEKDFVTAQVVSTRDIVSGVWNDWFTGEHIFPQCKLSWLVVCIGHLKLCQVHCIESWLKWNCRPHKPQCCT